MSYHMSSVFFRAREMPRMPYCLFLYTPAHFPAPLTPWRRGRSSGSPTQLPLIGDEPLNHATRHPHGNLCLKVGAADWIVMLHQGMERPVMADGMKHLREALKILAERVLILETMLGVYGEFSNTGYILHQTVIPGMITRYRMTQLTVIRYISPVPYLYPNTPSYCMRDCQ
uniref:Uncharacterized protein n=1 Tax=Eptatretus burgeri TaxID=7764 RepID=A0A8C4NMI7_EPTBU